MAKQNFYTTPASKLNMTAKELVHNRIANVVRMMKQGKRIQDTAMTRAFAASV